MCPGLLFTIKRWICVISFRIRWSIHRSGASKPDLPLWNCLFVYYLRNQHISYTSFPEFLCMRSPVRLENTQFNWTMSSLQVTDRQICVWPEENARIIHKWAGLPGRCNIYACCGIDTPDRQQTAAYEPSTVSPGVLFRTFFKLIHRFSSNTVYHTSRSAKYYTRTDGSRAFTGIKSSKWCMNRRKCSKITPVSAGHPAAVATGCSLAVHWMAPDHFDCE